MQPEDTFEQVRFALEGHRRMGVDFSTAWRRAIDAVPPIAGNAHARSNAERSFNDEVWAIVWARDWWQAGFENRPPPEPRYPMVALDDERQRTPAVAA